VTGELGISQLGLPLNFEMLLKARTINIVDCGLRQYSPTIEKFLFETKQMRNLNCYIKGTIS